MMKFISGLAFAVLLFLSACQKNNEDGSRTCNPGTDGAFSATINGQAWTACNFNAVYYSKDKILNIKAIDADNNFELRFFITLDSVTPVKTYPINGTGSSGLEVIEGIHSGNNYSSDIYFCDLFSPAGGGSITLTTLDTVSGKISASFSITGYSQNQQKTITLSGGVLDNVKLTKSGRSLPEGSYISATINGGNWYNRYVTAGVNQYIGSPVYSFLEVRAMGYPIDLGDCPQYGDSYSRNPYWDNSRNFIFNIPLSQGPGTYPLQASNQYTQTIASQHYLLAYNHHDYAKLFYPQAGSSITITSIDTANRNLDATFFTQIKDGTGTVINCTTGKIRIRKWAPMY